MITYTCDICGKRVLEEERLYIGIKCGAANYYVDEREIDSVCKVCREQVTESVLRVFDKFTEQRDILEAEQEEIEND